MNYLIIIFSIYSSFLFAIPEGQVDIDKILSFENQFEKINYISHDKISLYGLYQDKGYKHTLLIVPGTSEPAKKYLEVAYDLSSLPYNLAIIELRSQGESNRSHPDSKIIHIENFSDYILDIELFLKKILSDKVSIVGHSLGGLISLRYAQKNSKDIQKLVLVAPMLRPNSKWIPTFIVKAILNVQKFLGLQRSYVKRIPKKTPPPPVSRSKVTNSKTRYLFARDLEKRLPIIETEGVSRNWLLEGIDAGEQAKRNIEQFQKPILVLSAINDYYVFEEDNKFFCNSHKDCEEIIFKKARHEILQEVDSIRNIAMNKIKNFLIDR